MWNSMMETMDRNEVSVMQLAKLNTQLEYIHSSSRFYQAKFSEIRRNDRRLSDLSEFGCYPFTEKDELRIDQITHGGLGHYSIVSMIDVIRVHSSSGTTGRPSFIGITASDHAQWTESLARVFWTMGVRPDDIFLHATGLSFFVGGLPVKDAIERIGATFVPIGTGASERLIQAAESLQATTLFCTPSYAQYLAEFLEEKLGRSSASLNLHRVLLGAEPGGGVPVVRDRIENLYSAEVREAYGNSDLLPAFAATCEANEGNHLLTPDLLYLEIIDPASGELLPWQTGIKGELVGTSLGRECCPLVRFRTRDHVLVNADPCACGRTSPRVLCVGRTDDMLIVAGVNVWPSSIMDVVGKFSGEVTGALRIFIPDNGPLVAPPLHIKVEAPEFEINSSLSARLEEAIRGNLQVKSRIELVAPNSLPRFEMKGSYIERGARI